MNAPMTTIALWHSYNSEPTATPIHGETALPHADCSDAVYGPLPATVAYLRPVAAPASEVAVLLVPPLSAARVSRNGQPMPVGLHGMQHGDRLDMAGHTYWVAVQPAAQRTVYDPEVHGADMFCFLSKKRLAAGDPIAFCPGVPGTPCGALYTQRAWDLLNSPESKLRCSGCGFHAGAASWTPPSPPERKVLDDLLPINRESGA
jgi:hypothetical protein